MTVKGFTTHNLIDAIHAGSLSGVLNALDDGADIEMPDMHGCSGLPLRTACFEGNLVIVRELLNHGANPNAITSDGPGAPLRLALRKGHQDIADLLRQKGAMPLAATITPETPDAHLPDEVVTLSPPGIKPDSIVEFTPSDTPPPTDETIVSLLPASKPGNLIEFSSSDTLLPSDDAETPNNFGTDTSLLSMDLLFLEANENPDASPQAPDRR
ncbi:MAG: ankyrin repeat domain-containing protein [Azonexus sp.]|nr:ankyrin repeat domain-containing protein [Azonexus sp.]